MESSKKKAYALMKTFNKNQVVNNPLYQKEWTIRPPSSTYVSMQIISLLTFG